MRSAVCSCTKPGPLGPGACLHGALGLHMFAQPINGPVALRCRSTPTKKSLTCTFSMDHIPFVSSNGYVCSRIRWFSQCLGLWATEGRGFQSFPPRKVPSAWKK